MIGQKKLQANYFKRRMTGKEGGGVRGGGRRIKGERAAYPLLSNPPTAQKVRITLHAGSAPSLLLHMNTQDVWRAG